MRRQTGNELDWQRIASSVGQIGGAIQGAGKYQDYREDKEREGAITGAQRQALELRREGFTPEETRAQMTGAPLRSDLDQNIGIGGDVAMNWNIPQRPTAYEPEIAEAGYQKALGTQKASIDAEIAKTDTDIKKKAQEYAQQFSGMSPQEMQNLDVTNMENPRAANIAKGNYFVEFGKTDEMRKLANQQKQQAKETLYNKFSSAVRTADTLLKDPTTINRNKGVSLMVEATNDMNNTAYRAEEITVNGQPMVQTFMVYDGERRDGDRYTPEEYSKVLKGITKEQYSQAFDKDQQLSLKMNKESLEKPLWLVNDQGQMVQVQTFRRPLDADHQYMVYSKEGGMYPVQDMQELRSQGFRNYTPSKTTGKGASKQSVTNNLKVLDKAIDLVKQSGKYTEDLDGNITYASEVDATKQGSAPAGEAMIMEAIQMMPSLGQALSEGDIQQLMQYINIPQSDDVYGELGMFEQPQQISAINRRVTPETNPELQVSPFQR